MKVYPFLSRSILSECKVDELPQAKAKLHVHVISYDTSHTAMRSNLDHHHFSSLNISHYVCMQPINIYYSRNSEADLAFAIHIFLMFSMLGKYFNSPYFKTFSCFSQKKGFEIAGKLSP